MKTQQELTALGLDSGTLAQFTGTEKHYRISRRHLLTDGTKHLAEQGACFWMMDAVASHLCGCDHSLLSDAHLGNQRLVTRELGGVPG